MKPPAGVPLLHAAALEKTKKACLVSASLSTPIHLEPDVREATPSQLQAAG